MKDEEKLAREFLRHRGYIDVVYEPDGKVPPDFLVNGRIAIEVRRLNQHYQSDSRAQGLEEIEKPLWDKIEKLALSLGPPTRGQSWFLFFDFHRPVERWKRFRPRLKEALQGFICGTIHEATAIWLGNRFKLEVLYPTSNPHPTFFVMGGCDDGDSGGWVLSEIERNLRICIREKTEKRNRNGVPEGLAQRVGDGDQLRHRFTPRSVRPTGRRRGTDSR